MDSAAAMLPHNAVARCFAPTPTVAVALVLSATVPLAIRPLSEEVPVRCHSCAQRAWPSPGGPYGGQQVQVPVIMRRNRSDPSFFVYTTRNDATSAEQIGLTNPERHLRPST